MDDRAALLALIGQKSKVNRHRGSFTGLSGTQVLVDVGGGPIPMDTITAYRPELGETVHVWFIDEIPFMVGPVLPKPGQGVVESLAGDWVNVQTDIGTIKCTYALDAEFTSGQSVKLFWSDGPHVIAVMSTTSDVQLPPDGGSGAQQSRVEEFLAVDSGQFNTRWQGNDPRASDSVRGAWFQGSKVHDTLQGWTATKGEVYLPLIRQLGECQIGVHAYGTKPAGWVDAYGLTPLPNRGPGWVEIPSVLAQTLIDLPAGGLAIVSGNGDNLWSGVASDGRSGAFRITATR